MDEPIGRVADVNQAVPSQHFKSGVFRSMVLQATRTASTLAFAPTKNGAIIPPRRF